MGNKYYIVTGQIDGQTEELFGSFDRADCVYEKECERDNWKEQGYKKITITHKMVNDTPDPGIYGENEAWKVAICKSLKNESVTVSVSDSGEDHFDLENSRDLNAIFEAVQATDSPIVNFYVNDRCIGYMLVLVGYGDESIMDYSVSDFMESIVN